MLLKTVTNNLKDYYKFNISFSVITTTSKLNALDHSIYSAINPIQDGEGEKVPPPVIHL